MRDKIQNNLKQAMLAKEEIRLSTLRLLTSAIHNKEIEKRTKTGESELSEEEILAAIRSEAKKRKDSIAEFAKGGREDLVQKETSELKILEEYLPQEIADEEIEKIVKEVAEGFENLSPKEFGKIMGEVMKKVKGEASGERVSAAVKKILEK